MIHKSLWLQIFNTDLPVKERRAALRSFREAILAAHEYTCQICKDRAVSPTMIKMGGHGERFHRMHSGQRWVRIEVVLRSSHLGSASVACTHCVKKEKLQILAAGNIEGLKSNT